MCKSLKPNADHFQIVRHDRTMEQIVFPVPNICEFLTRESKYRVFNTTERDEQGSKVNDFFQQTEDLYNEMKWQKKIRSECETWGGGRGRVTWPETEEQRQGHLAQFI